MSSGPSPRMSDVAARCGVSESTVSHVLNGTKKVAKGTQDKILAAILELNYHRDSDARRLARGRSNFLGLVISDIENPFYPGLIKAFESAATNAGYEMLLSITNYEPKRTENAFRKMIENKVSGVAVMTSRVDPSMAEYLMTQGIASVFLDGGKPELLKSNVRVDYRKGTSAAVNYLYNLGHREFALIAGPQSRASHFAYRDCVVSELQELNLVPQIIVGTNDVASGETSVLSLLSSRPLPTAILCSNDLTAISAMRTFVKSGIRVPQDVSVVGADDIPFAGLTQPPLTTVRMPREKLGRLAFDVLTKTLDKEPQMGTENVLETELVIRESTGSVVNPR
jgi:DNA-binding LacI/PurR family transcriptional regulator